MLLRSQLSGHCHHPAFSNADAQGSIAKIYFGVLCRLQQILASGTEFSESEEAELLLCAAYIYSNLPIRKLSR